MLINSDPNIAKRRFFEIFQKVNKMIISESVLTKDEKEKIISDFIQYVEKVLNLSELPEITISYEENEATSNKSFGGYNPSSRKIRIVFTNRNLADGLRTLAHELKHYEQDINGNLNNKSGETGSEQENEANSFAGVVMRNYGKLNPKIFE